MTAALFFIYYFNQGSGSVLVGRLDFKSSLRGGDPVVGEFDSHTLPPNKARFYRHSSQWTTQQLISTSGTLPP